MAFAQHRQGTAHTYLALKHRLAAALLPPLPKVSAPRFHRDDRESNLSFARCLFSKAVCHAMWPPRIGTIKEHQMFIKAILGTGVAITLSSYAAHAQ